jgi:carnitine O-palmitoyltransferase 1
MKGPALCSAIDVEPVRFLLQVALSLLNDVDLRVYMHNAYGKGFMKECRVSPDAFIQMALQLAYYRVS